jgi:hypothetical protein
MLMIVMSKMTTTILTMTVVMMVMVMITVMPFASLVQLASAVYDALRVQSAVHRLKKPKAAATPGIAEAEVSEGPQEDDGGDGGAGDITDIRRLN